jgi:hypothetical protein
MTDLSAYVAAAEKAFEQTKQLLSDNGAFVPAELVNLQSSRASFFPIA